jgi:cell wall-associated NlpC family hydrolase
MSLSLVVVPVRQATGATLAERAYQVAVTRLGDPFRYAGKGPHVFDCSGLTWYSYRAAGQPIGRTIADQYHRSSRRISSSAAQRGDLVFFLSHGLPVHVGLYAGGGYVIHANSGSYFGRKVIRERIAFYWAKFFSVEYRRVR